MFPSSIVSAEWPFHIFSHLNPTVLPDDPVSHLTENIVTTEREHLPRTRPREVSFDFVLVLDGRNNSVFRRNNSLFVAGVKILGVRTKLKMKGKERRVAGAMSLSR